MNSHNGGTGGMKNMPVNEYKAPTPNRKSNSSFTPNSGNAWSPYDNAVMNATLEIGSMNAVQEERRPRSPVQKVLRYRLDDPELTSLMDNRYKPYRGKQIHGTNRYFGNKNQQKENWGEQSDVQINKTSNYDTLQIPFNAHSPNDEDATQSWNRIMKQSVPVKESEFKSRCLDLGVTYNWYKLKKSDNDGTMLENIAIEMKHGQKPFKIYGGFHAPDEAREIAFQEGLRRLNFLFGKIGEHGQGFLKNPVAEENVQIHQNMTLEMLPNPLNQFQWNALPPPPPPPPLPKFAPPSKPPLPYSPPPMSHQTDVNPLPLPPGVNISWEGQANYGYGSAPQSQLMPTVCSKWDEISSSTGFYGYQSNASALLPFKTEASLACKQDEFKQLWDTTTTDTFKKSSNAALYEADPGPNEKTFQERLKTSGWFQRCIELESQTRHGIHYYGFEIQFWKWNSPSCVEKAVGNFSPFVGIARESVFELALQKINAFGNGIIYSEDTTDNDFRPNKWDPLSNTLQDSDGDKLPKRLSGRGRGLVDNRPNCDTRGFGHT